MGKNPEWEPEKGFTKKSIIVRDEYYQRILELWSRTGKKPWEIIDRLLAPVMDANLPPPADLDEILKPKKSGRK